MNLIWIPVLWMSLVCEQARPDLLPSGCLVIPLAVACLFWLQNSVGILIAGVAMLMHWLLRPERPPLDGIAMILLAAFFMTRSLQQRWSPANGQPPGTRTEWKPRFLITLAGLLIHCGSVSGFQGHEFLVAIKSRLAIAVPLLIVTLVVSHAADEFGLRPRQATP